MSYRDSYDDYGNDNDGDSGWARFANAVVKIINESKSWKIILFTACAATVLFFIAAVRDTENSLGIVKLWSEKILDLTCFERAYAITSGIIIIVLSCLCIYFYRRGKR